MFPISRIFGQRAVQRIPFAPTSPNLFPRVQASHQSCRSLSTNQSQLTSPPSTLNAPNPPQTATTPLEDVSPLKQDTPIAISFRDTSEEHTQEVVNNVERFLQRYGTPITAVSVTGLVWLTTMTLYDIKDEFDRGEVF